MSLPVLSAEEQRVLGCLLEKQRTVPASYPLSLNALRLACNQSSSRDPIVDYSERDIQDTARALKDHGLLRLVWAGAGSRTVKYHQLLDELLPLGEDQRALLTVLLLRGPQSPGELKTRTERLHAFADRTGVVTGSALFNLQERGSLFVAPGDEVYMGMIVGENPRPDDMDVNPTKEKKLTNVRMSTGDELERLIPPRLMSLEQSLEYCREEECLEVTPKTVRIRKLILDANERARTRSRAKRPGA